MESKMHRAIWNSNAATKQCMGGAVKTSKTRALLVIKEYKLGNIKETAGSNPEGFVCLACEVNRGERWD